MPLHDLSGKVALITGVGCIGEGWGNDITISPVKEPPSSAATSPSQLLSALPPDPRGIAISQCHSNAWRFHILRIR